jgi:zinc transport system permease protein
MLDDFLIRAALAGIGLALAAGPLGCFVVWRRMAYFGDATAHAAILGVALSLAFSLSLFVGVLVAALAMSLGVLALAGRLYTMDTLLGVAAHGALALGLVAVSFLPGVRVDLMAYLDLAVIWIGAVVVLILLRLRWQALLLVTLSTDLAAARGYDARREQLILTLALAVLVAVAIKIVGALLITAMLIIPAAAARSMSRTPESMAVIAAIVGLCSIISGLSASFYWNTPTGPTMIVAAIILFVLASLWSVVNRGR